MVMFYLFFKFLNYTHIVVDKTRRGWLCGGDDWRHVWRGVHSVCACVNIILYSYGFSDVHRIIYYVIYISARNIIGLDETNSRRAAVSMRSPSYIAVQSNVHYIVYEGILYSNKWSYIYIYNNIRNEWNSKSVWKKIKIKKRRLLRKNQV